MFAMVLLLSVAIGSSAFAEGKEGFTPGSEPDGFRGVKWGTPISELKDFEYQGTLRDGRKAYARVGDNMRIGDAQLRRVVYFFENDVLSSVTVATKPGYCGELKEAVVAWFGEGYENGTGGIEFNGPITWTAWYCKNDTGLLHLTSFKNLEQQVAKRSGSQR